MPTYKLMCNWCYQIMQLQANMRVDTHFILGLLEWDRIKHIPPAHAQMLP